MVWTAFALALGATGRAAGNLVPILNAFLASIAKSHPEFKADIRFWHAGEPITPGYQMGHSAAMGDYTFRPKTWAELSEGERADVLNHPNLKAFIVSVRNARIYPAISAANPDRDSTPGWYPVEGADPSPKVYRVKIDPDEMLRNRTVTIPVTPVANP